MKAWWIIQHVVYLGQNQASILTFHGLLSLQQLSFDGGVSMYEILWSITKIICCNMSGMGCNYLLNY